MLFISPFHSGTAPSSFNLPSPDPYMRYWTPRNASQPAWNMPHSLNAQGISVTDVKNQNIFIASPASQLARTETRNPLHDWERALANI